ncbi:MAG: histidine--tRNA ligase [Candidatus Harrisonbacteria bacterium CG10_big_fil_rev_8_21_14_0_10_49_15]|uniref:Histidine--tRNA ligase n=1 Tax=Candidatus Harrisonbacteria bacterium CG10_big_fil_rev_8_21_14_0_10_49_15 TaxID=1974587 RepID=A0A2H0UJX4_9BACT|nr:MAG: histidine--tRNA ligase [Candidatus Harrisonbacteria bacterium CG10_big_fil_rev_8_21_14_0_10_49_15]
MATSKKKKVATQPPQDKPAKKKAPVQSARGVYDILPVDQPVWERIYRVFSDIVDYYNFRPITTPIVEPLELYERSSGETSDIVEKQMFTLKNRGSGGLLALRPEGTAGVVRAYLEHGMSHWPHPVKLSYSGPFFRYEKPQLGRNRQFFQVGFEIFSSENDPVYDAQIILSFYRFLEQLKIKGVIIQINSIGCRSCRPEYRKKLVQYYKPLAKTICKDCQRRLEKNPMRLLDCKQQECLLAREDAPIMLDHLCGDCKKHFTDVLEYLGNLELPYALNHYLVRGLDYYTKTVFELTLAPVEGEEDLSFALGGGGRYDYLVEMLGGRPTPAVGAAPGIDRIVAVLKHRQIVINRKTKENRAFFIHIGDLAKKKSLCIIESLRKEGLGVIEALGKESLGAQLGTADKMEAPLALIFGQKEAYEEAIIIRDMKTGAQETVPLAKLAKMIKKKLASA